MPDTKRDLTPEQEQEMLRQIVTPHDKPSCVNYGVDDVEEAVGGYFGDEEAEAVADKVKGKDRPAS